MKASTACTVGVVLSAILVLSSAAIATEDASKGGIKLTSQRQPGTTSINPAKAAAPKGGTNLAPRQPLGTVKINPANLKIKKTVAHSHADKLKSKLKELQDMATLISNKIPTLEQRVTALLNKKAECLNRTFTTADMTAAGCMPQNSLADCEMKLYYWCFQNEWNAAKGESSTMYQFNMVPLLATSQSARGLLEEWSEHIESGME